MEKENIKKVVDSLLQIHAFAKILERDEMENPQETSDLNELSCKKLSLYQVIAEKAELCITAIGSLELDKVPE